jgi:DNA modification methylase
MLEIAIDPEFRDLIPPLSETQYEGLKKAIIGFGKAYEPIKLWNGIVIDGHNRFKICSENNVPFKTTDYTTEFKTRDNVIDWIFENQLSRRNLSSDQYSYLRGMQNLHRMKMHGAPIGNVNASKQSGQNDHFDSTKTREVIAQEQHVAPRTVQRDTEYARAVNAIIKTVGIDTVKQKILTGDIKAAKKDIIELAKTTPEIQKEIITKSLERETNVKTLLNEEKRQQQISERNVIIPTKTPDNDSDLKNMDCLDYLKILPNDSVDLVLTDPPYEISRETGFKDMTNGVDRLGVSMEFGEWDNPGNVDLDAVIRELFRVTKKGGTAILFYDLWKITPLQEMMIKAGFKQLRFIEWVKKNPVPLNSKINYLTNAREIALVGIKGSNPKFHSEYDNGIYSHPIYHSKHRIHPTQKPVELMCELIEKHSDVGDVVADVFLGSGTTVVAAIKKHRKCIGCEIDSKMYARMMERITDVTKKSV